MFSKRLWRNAISPSSPSTGSQSQLSNSYTNYGTTASNSIFSRTKPATSDNITYEVEVPKPKFTASSKWQDADGERIWKLEFTCEHLDSRIFFQVVYTPCVSELRSYVEATHNSSQFRWEISNPPMTDEANMMNVEQRFIPEVIATKCSQALAKQWRATEVKDPVGTGRFIDMFWTLELQREMFNLIFDFVPTQWRLEQKRKPTEMMSGGC